VFKSPVGTSRGIMTDRDIWFIIIKSNKIGKFQGIGECGPLKGLSMDPIPKFKKKLLEVAEELEHLSMPKDWEHIEEMVEKLVPPEFPSIRFGVETALLDLLNGGKRILFHNDFVQGIEKLPINGLIWMGDRQYMVDQISELITKGFHCLKMKIGALDFETECELLQLIREQFPGNEMEIRVDANGVFSLPEARVKLEILSVFNLHSIEQPLAPGQIKEMKELCEESPVPIALDEELIGTNQTADKESLLATLKPAYIVLKPTLLGGMRSTQEWVEAAKKLNIGWWITSALESNVGLNAVSQFTYYLNPKNYQGLGTGQLYSNNFPSPLSIDKGFLTYNIKGEWELTELLQET